MEILKLKISIFKFHYITEYLSKFFMKSSKLKCILTKCAPWSITLRSAMQSRGEKAEMKEPEESKSKRLSEQLPSLFSYATCFFYWALKGLLPAEICPALCSLLPSLSARPVVRRKISNGCFRREDVSAAIWYFTPSSVIYYREALCRNNPAHYYIL